MIILRTIFSRILDVIDAAYDGLGAIARVLARGAFARDQYSLRSSRFDSLKDSQVLIQRATINAKNDAQARRIVTTDPERYVPFSINDTLTDVVLVAEAQRPSPRSTQAFAIGVLPRETAKQLRAARQTRPFSTLEGFVFRPSPDATPLFFEDATGIRQRRHRRASLAMATIALAAAVWDLDSRFSSKLNEKAANANKQTSLAQAHIRAVEREVTRLDIALKELQPEGGLSARNATILLDRLAEIVPPESGIESINTSPHSIIVRARTYDAKALELALRRGFEASAIDFSRVGAGPPDLIEATIGRAPAHSSVTP